MEVISKVSKIGDLQASLIHHEVHNVVSIVLKNVLDDCPSFHQKMHHSPKVSLSYVKCIFPASSKY